jgi:hypothetical protein
MPMPVGFGERVDLRGAIGDFLDRKGPAIKAGAASAIVGEASTAEPATTRIKIRFMLGLRLDRWMAVRRGLAAVFTEKKPCIEKYPSGPFRTIQRWEDVAHINV